MKKFVFSLAMLASTLVAMAQVEVTAKSFDLEPLNKHKGWQFGEAGVNPSTGNVFVKLLKPNCETSHSSDYFYKYTSFYGISWQVDKLTFDGNFNYIETQSKRYETTKDALLNNENIFGKKYGVVPGNISLAGMAMPKGSIDNSFLFTKIVAGSAGIGGFKVATSFIGLKFRGEVTKYGPDNCGENVVAYKEDDYNAKEEKGQSWIPVYNNPVPNGGNILFNTAGVNKEEKQHYVFRKYDSNATVIAEKSFTFDYQCLITAKEIEKAPGVFDYVFVTLPINYKKSKLPVAAANSYEYFYVDGSTYEIKDRLTIVAPTSQWLITQVYAKDGAVYLCGDSGKTASTYADFSVPNPKDYPNFQIAKIENGKLVYAKSNAPENIEAALINVNGEKTKSDLNFKVHTAQMNAINGKFIYSGRNENVKSAVFNEKGDLEAFILKEAEFSENYITFSKDKKTMYSLVQNVLEYNKWDKKTGTITPKAAKQVITALSIVSYNLENKKVKYEDFKNENWGVKFSNQILMDSDDKLLLLGTNITKKAKESEYVFITIKK